MIAMNDEQQAAARALLGLQNQAPKPKRASIASLLHSTTPPPPVLQSTTPAMSSSLVARSAFNRSIAAALARRSLRPLALQGLSSSPSCRSPCMDLVFARVRGKPVGMYANVQLQHEERQMLHTSLVVVSTPNL